MIITSTTAAAIVMIMRMVMMMMIGNSINYSNCSYICWETISLLLATETSLCAITTKAAVILADFFAPYSMYH